MESSRWKARPPSHRGRKKIHIQAPPEKAAGFPITLQPAACCLPQLGLMHHVSPLEHLQEFSISLLQLNKASRALPDQVLARKVGPGAKLPGFESQIYPLAACVTLASWLE